MAERKPRILLIQPPFYRLFKDRYSLSKYPLWMGYLAGSILRGTNWSVMAYNSDFTPESENVRVSHLAGPGFRNYLENIKRPSAEVWAEIRRTIAEYSPAVVGISATSASFASARLVASLAKAVNGQTLVVMGGPHPSSVGAQVLAYPEIDICVKGEGENTIVELLDAVANGNTFEGIRGITYREGGRVVENAPRELISDLDSLSFPHESAPQVLKDYDRYARTAFQYIFATRGCPYNCAFCGSRNIWTRKVRFRSPENVVKEIQALLKKGLRAVHFDDDTFGVKRPYIGALCNALAAHCPGVRWSCEMPVKLVDEQTIGLMKAAGCYSVFLGVESGSNEILRQVRKNITIEEALSASRLIKRHGIAVEAFFMVGFPQETKETLNETYTAMKKIGADRLVYSIFTPYPGTEMFDLLRQKGLIGDDYDVSLYNHHSPANCFSVQIDPATFRRVASRIERMVDRKNFVHHVRRLFSVNTIWRVRQLGVTSSLRKGARILLGK
jgi:radical SAM superfamily enzyme YgiQ (UPF0313 family)